MMVEYKNLGGDSGISAYETAANSITVRFSDGAVYLYTYASAGSQSIELMKSLATSGKGLNSYINTNVRKRYERKLQ